jgi:hydrogenase maturation protease
MTGRVLVAGLGNVFLHDDGFGVEVARRLATRPLPANVEVADIGIRGVHLAFDLLDGADLLILADVAARGEPPGTVTVLEVDLPTPDDDFAPFMDAHDMGPDAVLALLRKLGGHVERTVVVACEPAELGSGIGLSGPVRAAVDAAVTAIERIAAAGVEEEETRVEQDDHRGRAGAAGGGRHPVASGHQALSGTS